VEEGEEIRVTQRGRVIARIVPEQSRRVQARAALTELSKTARLGDIESPIGEAWSVDE
jgi:antitoxin (DNA-binding transcriptional repressor) of toxin-antitoxin stability system